MCYNEAKTFVRFDLPGTEITETLLTNDVWNRLWFCITFDQTRQTCTQYGLVWRYRTPHTQVTQFPSYYLLLDTDLSRYWWSRVRCSRGRTSCLRSSQARPSESCRPSPWSCRPCPPSASRHGWSSQSTRHRLPISLQPADSWGYMSICQTYRFWLQFWFWEIMLLSVSSYSHGR